MLKKELLLLVQQNKPQFKAYVIDQLAEEHGHKILRLPPYHSELNPIEYIWANIKGHVARSNVSFTMTKVKTLFEEGHQRVQESSAWAQAVSHVIKDEDIFWQQDGLGNQSPASPFIINTGDDTPNSSQDLTTSQSSCSSVGDVPCCICGTLSTGEDRTWFGCDDCPKWFHIDCMAREHQESARKSLATDLDWACPRCCEDRRCVCLRCEVIVRASDPTLIHCSSKTICYSCTHVSCLPATQQKSIRHTGKWTCPSCSEE